MSLPGGKAVTVGPDGAARRFCMAVCGGFAFEVFIFEAPKSPSGFQSWDTELSESTLTLRTMESLPPLTGKGGSRLCSQTAAKKAGISECQLCTPQSRDPVKQVWRIRGQEPGPEWTTQKLPARTWLPKVIHLQTRGPDPNSRLHQVELSRQLWHPRGGEGERNSGE